MDSTNINTKEEGGLDIRDVANYILGKIWIVLLAMVCAAVVAVIFTSTVTPTYKSRSTLFITNTQDSISSSQTVSDWTIGRQLATTSPELVTEVFCDKVAAKLNEDLTFVSKYGEISGRTLLSYISVDSDSETCMVTFTVTTTNPEYSKILVDEVTSYFGTYINDFMKSDSIRTMQAKLGEVNNNPSNIHTVRNASLAAIIGGIVAAAILVIIFMFDDKIKTADDIDRYLKISVLGVIPEIDVEQ
ncbi:MAG: hypothetical protein E7622_00030 [Ruminococcaceae bacterium]|nr:hypothetical protein [Oscillospiraceae bacterium]